MEVTRAGADANSLALRQLRTWTSECSSLRVFMVLGSPKNFEAYITKRLDGKPGPSASELDDTWYYSMLVCPPLILPHAFVAMSIDPSPNPSLEGLTCDSRLHSVGSLQSCTTVSVLFFGS